VTRYDTGRRFEWLVRDDLADNGYEVSRAAGSKGSSKVDLFAFKPGQMLFVQAKGNGTLGPAEWNRLVEVAAWVGAVPVLAAKAGRGLGIAYTRLTGQKIPHKRVQPCELFLPDELAVTR
jgi:holliday junction resolvase Hjr